MRWILIVLLMCNGIYYLWQSYLVDSGGAVQADVELRRAGMGEELVLLSELPGSQTEPEPRQVNAQLPPAKSAADAAALAIEPALCWMIGPFKDDVSLKLVVGRLDSLDINLRMHEIVIPGEPDYRVHIAPQPSRKLALKLLRELQAKKIDSFLITEGELENGLSLGFFTQQPRAEAVLKQRLEQGYPAIVKVVPREHRQKWAIFEAGEYDKFSDTLWEKVREGNPGLERRKNFCEKIAPANNLD